MPGAHWQPASPTKPLPAGPPTSKLVASSTCSSNSDRFMVYFFTLLVAVLYSPLQSTFCSLSIVDPKGDLREDGDRQKRGGYTLLTTQ